MLIGELMRHDVKTCRPDDSIQHASQLMWEAGCGSLPIVDHDGEVLAIVTDRDLCMACCREGLSAETTPVGNVASYGVLTVRDSDPIERAEALMRKHHIRRLPVVNDCGKPVGIVSLYDLARYAYSAARHGDALTPESVVRTEIALGIRASRSG
jgi:CBS domain-containing protein